MLTLHVEAATLPELVEAARKALTIPQSDAPAAPSTSTAEPVAAQPPAPAATLPTPAPHTPRRKRADPPATTPTPSPAAPDVVTTSAATSTAPAAPAAAASPAPSVEDVRKALNDVNGALGMGVCTAILTEFGAQRVSLVPEDKRVAFIAACNKRVADNKAVLVANAAAKAA